MNAAHPARFSAEQRSLWERVQELWALSQSRDDARLMAALHPDYAGWDMSSPATHDREAAVRSVSGDAPRLKAYRLQPHSVRVYEGGVGVAHYSYVATIAPGGAELQVSGKWTEVYLRQSGTWVMIAVGGRPDAEKAA